MVSEPTEQSAAIPDGASHRPTRSFFVAFFSVCVFALGGGISLMLIGFLADTMESGARLLFQGIGLLCGAFAVIGIATGVRMTRRSYQVLEEGLLLDGDELVPWTEIRLIEITPAPDGYLVLILTYKKPDGFVESRRDSLRHITDADGLLQQIVRRVPPDTKAILPEQLTTN